MSELGTYIKLYEEDGAVCIAAEYESQLAAAHAEWIEKKVDRHLAITTLAGQPYYTSASRISSILVSAPDTRIRELAIERMSNIERKESLLEAGYTFVEIEEMDE